MTARFSWNQQNTRGHRPRLQLFALEPAAEADIRRADLRFPSKAVGVDSPEATDAFFCGLPPEWCVSGSLNDLIQDPVGSPGLLLIVTKLSFDCPHPGS